MSDLYLYVVAPQRGYPITAIFGLLKKALDYRNNFCPNSYRVFRVDVSSGTDVYSDFEKYTTALGVKTY